MAAIHNEIMAKRITTAILALAVLTGGQAARPPQVRTAATKPAQIA